MKTKLKYAIDLFHLSNIVTNKLNLCRLIINPGKERLLKLNNGLGFYITHHLDAHVIFEIFINRDYYLKLDRVKTIFDIGAHVGIASIFLSTNYPSASIYAFEPNNKSYRRLKKNLKYNKISNVKVFNWAIVGKSTPKRTLFVDSKSGMSTMFGRSDKELISAKQTVTTKTLSKVLKAEKIKSVDLVKMDCEGAEYEILLGLNPSAYRQFKAFVIEYHDDITEHTHQDLIDIFKKNSYQVAVNKNLVDESVGIICAHRLV